ncbi:MAG: restriction endonuclease subunit S [Thiobacillus sp.]|nr:restriction endonuclease subunit S [Thiobacillus sp.]
MDVNKWHELFQPYSVYGGELLITKLGEPPGVCAIYPEGVGPAMVTPDVIKLSVNADVVLPRYLMHYFNSETARRFSTGAAFGTTRLRLTIPIFRGMPVPLPPFKEQQEIVAEIDRSLSLADEAEDQVNTNLKRSEILRRCVLQRSFCPCVLA